MMIVYDGTAYFQVGDHSFEVIAPCFVCFDETENPKLIRKRGLNCDSVYFKPTFLNVNMSFSRLHSENYEHLASTHDMFLLKPFTDKKRYVFPIFDDHTDTLRRLFSMLERSLREQTDWYWSCRSRSYFMEVILLLERAYGLIEYNDTTASERKISNPHLRKAVVFIETNYYDHISLESIGRSASLNHSTLTGLFKTELNMTPIEYLWYHRLTVAKKFLEFTSLPIKEIASRCGFKTVQHFCRKFEETVGKNPGNFRSEAVEARKKNFLPSTPLQEE